MPDHVPGAAFRAALAAVKLSQREIARRLGRGPEIVGAWALGRRLPKGADLISLERMLGRSGEELFPEAIEYEDRPARAGESTAA